MFLSVFVLLTYVQKRLRCYVVLEHTQYPHIRISSVGEMRESCANFQKKLFVYKTTKFKRKNRLLLAVES